MSSKDNNLLILDTERILNNSDFAGNQSKVWNLDEYLNGIRVEIVNEQQAGMELEFDLLRVETPIANAIRRVLLAEVPSMAINQVYMYQNTSIIQDEVLAHRLGLLPIGADPRLFEFPPKTRQAPEWKSTDCQSEPTDNDIQSDVDLIFDVKLKCQRNVTDGAELTDPNDLYLHASVYSGDFVWRPVPAQEKRFAIAPRMVHDDILVAKLRPGQEIEARCRSANLVHGCHWVDFSCYCIKGIGREHAKFSPVCTATYRILSIINLLGEITGKDAHTLMSCFSRGVIGIIEENGIEKAVVLDARKDLCSRNIHRHEDLAKLVQLGRRKDHFIFSVESVGALRSSELVVEACKVLENKARSLASIIRKNLAQKNAE